MFLEKAAKKWILSGIPIIIAFGSLMHFVYGWTGSLIIAGIFTPVNESVWEHLKMTFYPVLIWWIFSYFKIGKKSEISAGDWFSSCAIAEIICSLTIVSFFYTYTGALGIESLILDIFSMILGVTAGQCLALHFYNHKKYNKYSLYISIAVLIFLAAAFTVFTFYSPGIPLFMDPLTGKFGL